MQVQCPRCKGTIIQSRNNGTMQYEIKLPLACVDVSECKRAALNVMAPAASRLTDK